ncbi:hypothetical protein BH10BAC3_BH10BAC3_41130 [soil metagenome]
MRIILDCNILVMSLQNKSSYHQVFKAFLDERYTLLISQLIIHEYTEIISIKFGAPAAGTLLDILNESNNTEVITVYFNWNLIASDPDDNKYCDCYIAGGADYLVTQDKHFKALANIQFPTIKVISIDEFLVILDQ